MVNYAADNQKLNGALLVESVKWTQAINNVNNVNNRNRVIFEKVWKEIVQEVQGSIENVANRSDFLVHILTIFFIFILLSILNILKLFSQ